MIDVINAKQDLLEYIKGLDRKLEFSKIVTDDYFEPGMMENLEQYLGDYNEAENIITLRVDAKGLRYDNRTKNLERISVGCPVQIVRDSENVFNSNNFCIKNKNDSLGNLPAELCNALAPLFDMGYAVITAASVSYIERLRDRSRYAKQGVLFVEIIIKIRGV